MPGADCYKNVRYIRRRKKYAAPVFGLWLFLLFCCVLAAYFFMHSAFFSLRYINIMGNNVLTAERIIKLSGLNTGDNIFKIDTRDAVAKIEVYPSIKNVIIKRKLPDTLQVVITERVPAALVVTQDGFIVVDDEAICLQKINDLKEIQLPIISGIPVKEDIIPGSNLSTTGLAVALSLVSLMDKEFMVNVTEIIANTPESLSLKTVQGVEVRFGKPEDLERKIKVVEDLLIDNGSVINSETVEYIDLRYNTTPVIKRKF